MSTVEQWNGLMPIPVPWWVFLAVALPSVVLMALVWPVARHHREAAGRVVVRATPLWFALFAAIAAVITLSASLYYIDLDEWPGLYAVPAVLLALVAAIGIVRGVTTRPTSPRSQRVR